MAEQGTFVNLPAEQRAFDAWYSTWLLNTFLSTTTTNGAKNYASLARANTHIRAPLWRQLFELNNCHLGSLCTALSHLPKKVTGTAKPA